MAAASREPFNVTARSKTTGQQHSPSQSPVPYLFTGLAAMLGLIGLALLILACSYWKLSGHFDGENGSSAIREPDPEVGEGNGKGEDTRKKEPLVIEEKLLVIMAGENKPRFLATPISTRCSSVGDGKSSNSDEKNEKSVKMVEKVKQRVVDYQIQSGNREIQDNSYQTR